MLNAIEKILDGHGVSADDLKELMAEADSSDESGEGLMPAPILESGGSA